MRFQRNKSLFPLVGIVFVILWVYLTFFSYPSVLWVENTEVFEKNWDTYIDFSNSIENASNYEVVVLPSENENVERLLGEGGNLLIIGESEKYKKGCHELSNSRVCVVVDGNYGYPIYYLSGREILFYFNQIAFVFLIIGIVLLRNVFMDKRFHILIIFLFALLGVRKYIVGLPLTYDFYSHVFLLWARSQNIVFTNYTGSGIPIGHYYPPLYYEIFSIFVSLMGVINTIKLGVFLTLFLSGISAYFFIPKMIKNYRYGIISAIIYMLAPFMLWNLNVRSGLWEAFVLIFVPAIFYFLKRVLETKEWKYTIGFIISYFFVIISHVPSTIIIFFAIIMIVLYTRKLSRIFRVLKCLLISFLLASFWLFPLLAELDYPYYECVNILRFGFFKIFTPNSLECGGLCPIQLAFYVGLVFSILSVSGMLLSIRKRKNIPYIIVFVLFFLVFIDQSLFIYNVFPLFTFIIQWTVRFFVVLSFIMVFFSSVTIKEIERAKIFRKIGKYLPLLILGLFILDIYPLTGASVHSKDPDYVLFSFDAFKKHSELAIPPDEYKAALKSVGGDGKLIMGHDRYVNNRTEKMIFRVMPESSAAIFFNKEVISPGNYQSININYNTANLFVYKLYSINLSRFLDYMNVKYLILESDLGYPSLILQNRTKHLYIFKNPHAEGRISVYNQAVFLSDSSADTTQSSLNFLKEYYWDNRPLFSTDSLDMTKVLFLTEPNEFVEKRTIKNQRYLRDFDYREPEIDVKVLEWEDTYISLDVDSKEENGFVLVRVNAQPDWVLKVNGEEREILKAQPYYIAINVERGKHKVELIYTYFNWRHLTGYLLTLIGIVLLFFQIGMIKLKFK